MNKKINIYVFVIVLVILGFIFQPVIQDKITIFQWYDEIMALLLFLHFLICVITGKITKILKSELYCILFMILLVGIGVIGNITANIETRVENHYYRYSNKSKNIYDLFRSIIVSKQK